ncbi:MAG: hypothetical protein H7A39_06390 [Chlamydiales bacterium]|nr:hypothetical protein [Chlamydiales bacterium]
MKPVIIKKRFCQIGFGGNQIKKAENRHGFVNLDVERCVQNYKYKKI